MNDRRRASEALEALLGLTIFESCTGDQLAPLLPHADVLTVPAATILERKGILARQMIGIVDGSVRAFDATGRPLVLRPGDQIGAAEVLDRSAHTTTYTTATTARIVVVFGPAFSALARATADLGERAQVETASESFERVLAAAC